MGYITLALIPLLSLLIPSYLFYYSSSYFSIVQFVSYYPPEKVPLVGVLAPNEKLKNIKRFAEGKLDAPESIAFDSEGNIFTGTADGNIIKIYKNESTELYARVGGRPLGLAFDKNNNLIICDSLKGLISVDPITRQTTVLASHVDDSPIFFADDLEIAKDGKIYFSDASNIGPVQRGDRWISLVPSVVAIIANEPKGRLLEYDPSTRKTRVLLDGMVYANGVALSKDETYILIAETGRPSVRRYYISGPKAGQSDYFVENLPGIPDGLNIADDGRVLVSFFSLRSPLEAIQPYVTIKKIAVALFPFLPLVPQRIGFVAVYDKQGNAIETLWDEKGTSTHTITDTHEKDGKLYMGSLSCQWIAVYDWN